VHQLFVFLAFFGLAYAGVAIFALGSGFTSVSRGEQQAKAARAERPARARKPPETGIYRALYWFVTLPVEAPGMALCLAGFMALPALLF
jgi:hypothetical protein